MENEEAYEIWDDGIQIIEEEPHNGKLYTNQTGGLACHHPEIRGNRYLFGSQFKMIEEVLIEYFTGPKWRSWCCDGIDEETALVLDAVLVSIRLRVDLTQHDVPKWTVNRTRLRESEEAWVHLVAGERTGVLTWSNSD